MEYEKALGRLMKQCSLSERCRKDCIVSLDRWEVAKSDQQKIIDYLVENKYVDENRYVAAYVKDKSRFSNWGEAKIKTGLRTKGISWELINEAVSEIDTEAMEEKIVKALETKLRGLKYKDKYDLRNKLLRFAFSRGYSIGVVNRFISEKLGAYEE